jgi:hypothetical protein
MTQILTFIATIRMNILPVVDISSLKLETINLLEPPKECYTKFEHAFFSISYLQTRAAGCKREFLVGPQYIIIIIHARRV